MAYIITDTWTHSEPKETLLPDYTYSDDPKRPCDVIMVGDVLAHKGKSRVTYGLTLKGNAHIQFILGHHKGIRRLSHYRLRDKKFTYISGEFTVWNIATTSIYLDFYTKSPVIIKKPSWIILRHWGINTDTALPSRDRLM